MAKKIKEKTFKDSNKQKKHTKVLNIEHKYLEILKYLKACNIRIAQKETQKNFQLKSKVFDVTQTCKQEYASAGKIWRHEGRLWGDMRGRLWGHMRGRLWGDRQT